MYRGKTKGWDSMKRRILCIVLALVMAAFMSIPATASAEDRMYSKMTVSADEVTIEQGQDVILTITLMGPYDQYEDAPIAGGKIYYYAWDSEDKVPCSNTYTTYTNLLGQTTTKAEDSDLTVNVASRLDVGSYNLHIDFNGNDGEYESAKKTVKLNVLSTEPSIVQVGADEWELQAYTWRQLDKALKASKYEEYDYVRMMDDMDVKDEDDFLSGPLNCKKTLDLNGHELTTEKKIEIGDGADLTIDDTSSPGEGETGSYEGGGIEFNYGEGNSAEMFNFVNEDETEDQSLTIKKGVFKLGLSSPCRLFSLDGNMKGCSLNLLGGRFAAVESSACVFWINADENKGATVTIDNHAHFCSSKLNPYCEEAYIFWISNGEGSTFNIGNATFECDGKLVHGTQTEFFNKLFDPHCVVYDKGVKIPDVHSIKDLEDCKNAYIESIMRLNPDVDTVTLSKNSYTYDGTAKKPTVTVSYQDNDGATKTLTKGTDYTVAYSNNKNAGTAKVTVTGKGKYKGTTTKTFTIKKASVDVSAAAWSGAATNTYSGSAKTIKLTNVPANAKASLTGNSATKVGAYTAKVTFTPASINYTITGADKVKTFSWKIVPKKATVYSTTLGKKGSKKLTVKMSTAVSKTGGAYYKIQYRIKGKTTWKTKTTTKQSIVLSKLTKGKAYQVRACAYKKIGTKTYAGAWSAVKTSGKIR